MTPLEKELARDRTYTKYQIVGELERELGMRRKLYTSWIATGRISMSDAVDRIHLLEQALTDLQGLYREEADPPIAQISLFPVAPDIRSQYRTY